MFIQSGNRHFVGATIYQQVMVDTDGNKVAVAEYDKGQKVGKWFFWSDSALSEVDYSDNRVASVKNWKKDNLVIAN